MRLDPAGEPYCIYRSLGQKAAAMELARYTFLDQWFVDEATSRLAEGFSGTLDRACSPGTCPRLLPKVADAVRA